VSTLRFTTARPFLVGVVHLAATPGAPRFAGSVHALLEAAVADARALAAGGVHALVVENFGDVPFVRGAVEPETVATLSLALAAVRAATPLPVGVNVLRNDARSALGLCAATGAAFLRVNVHTGSMFTDQGVLEGRAAETLRARARLCPGVELLADVHVKHATPPPGEDLVQAARDARHRGLADALIVSGAATGSAPSAADLARVREALPDTPLLVGSGLTLDNAAALLDVADGALVGTWVKQGGDVRAPVDPERVRALVAALA
jgi:membrane complex biogenesis BtpA family protein